MSTFSAEPWCGNRLAVCVLHIACSQRLRRSEQNNNHKSGLSAECQDCLVVGSLQHTRGTLLSFAGKKSLRSQIPQAGHMLLGMRRVNHSLCMRNVGFWIVCRYLLHSWNLKMNLKKSTHPRLLWPNLEQLEVFTWENLYIVLFRLDYTCCSTPRMSGSLLKLASAEGLTWTVASCQKAFFPYILRTHLACILYRS